MVTIRHVVQTGIDGVVQRRLAWQLHVLHGSLGDVMHQRREFFPPFGTKMGWKNSRVVLGFAEEFVEHILIFA